MEEKAQDILTKKFGPGTAELLQRATKKEKEEKIEVEWEEKEDLGEEKEEYEEEEEWEEEEDLGEEPIKEIYQLPKKEKISDNIEMKKVNSIINTRLTKEQEVEFQMAKEVEILIDKKTIISKFPLFGLRIGVFMQ